MQDGLASTVAVGFVGQHDQSHGAAVTLDGLIHSCGLYREGAAVVVRFAVNQQDWFIDRHNWNG